MSTKSMQLFNSKGFTPLEIGDRRRPAAASGGLSLTGFTLIELLVVMAIVLIVAGMVIGVSGPASRSAKIRKAEVMISALEVAIGMYHADTGGYPIQDGVSPTGCKNLYKGLVNGTLTFSGNPPWRGPYMEFKSGDLMVTGTDTEVKDPWGRSYKYEQPGTTPTTSKSFDLWSCGPDGKTSSVADKVDDIKNW